MQRLNVGAACLLVMIVAAGSRAQDQNPRQGEHGAASATAASSSVSLGSEVKITPVKDNNGEQVGLESFRRTDKTPGKVVVLTIWCSSCGSCRQIDKQLDKKAKDYAEKGAVFLAVDSNFDDDSDRVNGFLTRGRFGFRVLLDSDSAIARYFGARFTTTTAVIDAEGRLRYYGGFDKAEAAVKDLLAGKEVAVPRSPGSGCAIMLKPRDGETPPRGHGDGHGGHGKKHGADHGQSDDGHEKPEPGHD